EESHVFNQRLINTLRFGFNRISFVSEPVVKLNPTQIGINVGVDRPIGLPQINIAGALNFGGPARRPQGRTDTTFVFADAVSYTKGRHSLKFGGEYRAFYNNNILEDTGS